MKVIRVKQDALQSAQRFRQTVGDRRLLFRFYFNAQTERWYVDVGDTNGNPIISGQKVISGYLLSAYLPSRKGDSLPDGDFFVMADDGGLEDPTRSSLGAEHKITYIDETADAALYTALREVFGR